MVLSAAVLTKTGKVLVARQFQVPQSVRGKVEGILSYKSSFQDIPRLRMEGLLAAFPKLVGSAGERNISFSHHLSVLSHFLHREKPLIS